LLLTFTNHYNKGLNKCFIAVENHRKNLFLGDDSWVNEITITDVQENNRYGWFRTDHEVLLKPEYHVEERVSDCNMGEKHCKNLDEFNTLTAPYMNN
jgi:hypothetical protein